MYNILNKYNNVNKIVQIGVGIIIEEENLVEENDKILHDFDMYNCSMVNLS